MVAAFFATFDDRTGPTVNYEEPQGAFEEGSDGRRMWEQYSDYVMSGNPQLDGRLIKVRSGKDAVLCLSVVIRDDEKYRRNALLFSIGVLVPGKSIAAASCACRSALRRMARALRSMERETSALSREGNDEYLSQIIPDALRALRCAACAAVDDDDSASSPRRPVSPPAPRGIPLSLLEDDPNVFSLRSPFIGPPQGMFSSSVKEQIPDPVRQWHVPVLLASPEDLLGLNSPPTMGRETNKIHRYEHGDDAWDMGIMKVIPQVDGIRNVRQVARAANVDVDLVCKSLRALSHYGCLELIDTFQYSNIYRVTKNVSDLVLIPEALDSCSSFVLTSSQAEIEEAGRLAASSDLVEAFLERASFSVSFSGSSSRISDFTRRRREKISTVLLRLYCGFRDGRTVKDVFLAVGETYPDILDSFDHRAFAAFGALHGILVRVHRYPIATKNIHLYQQHLVGTSRQHYYQRRDRKIEKEEGGAIPNDDNLAPANRKFKKKRRRSRSVGATADKHLLLEDDDNQPKFGKSVAAVATTTTDDELPSRITKKLGDRSGQIDTTTSSSFAHKNKATPPADVMQLARILAFMDGEHCMDEICTDLELAPKYVEDIVRRAGYCIIDVFR